MIYLLFLIAVLVATTWAATTWRQKKHEFNLIQKATTENNIKAAEIEDLSQQVLDLINEHTKDS